MEEQHNTSSNLTQIGLKILLWSIGLSLIFFIPFLPIGLIDAKGIILACGAVIGMFVWLLDSISRGRFLLPHNKSWIVFLGVILAATITSLFVPHPRNSFIGTGFDFGTVSTLLIGFVYFFLFSVWGVRIGFTKHIIKTFFITGLIVVLFEVLQMGLGIVGLAPKAFIGLGQSNLIGSFNDLAIFLGAFVIMSAIAIENRFLNRLMKVISIVLLSFSLVLLLIINYTFVWQLVGLSGLALFIYHLMPAVNKDKTEDVPSTNKRGFSVIAFLLMVCAFVGIIGSTSIASVTAQKPFYFTNNESRPSLVATATILKHTYYNHPVVGAGLNRFNEAWEAGKVRVLNGRLLASPYWSASFTQGFSLFFTLLITLGTVGALLLILLMVLVIKKMAALFSKTSIENSRAKDLFVYGTLSLYTLLIFLFDTPNTALFVVIIAFWGMTIAYIDTILGRHVRAISFMHDSRHSFFSILSIMVGIIMLAFGGYVLSRSFYANYLVNRASVMPATMEGVTEGEAYMQKALSIANLDSYARLLTDVRVLRISAILNDTSKPEEQVRSLLRDSVTGAADSAKLAITIDPENNKNYLALLRVQEILIELGNTEVYTDAINTADMALHLSPNNPGILMRQAKIATLQKEYGDADLFINRILAVNPYYIDAYLLRSQIRVSEGNTAQAHLEIDEAARLNPRSAVLPYRKGLLFMDQGQYSNAAESFENALRLAPGSLDVYSALATAYEKLGNTDAVIQTLQYAKPYLQDASTVDTLIEKVRNGGSLSGTTVSNDEDADEETIKEKTKKEE